MGLIDQAKSDWQTFSTNKNQFGVDINISTPSDSENVDIVGLHTKHHIGINYEGNTVNTKNAHISFSEKLLTDAGYPVRNGDEVDLQGHKVTVKDSTESNKLYVIREAFPDETIGVIVCILGDFE